jgi:hypothetical protein
MLDEISLYLIMLCHFIVVCLVVGVPFFGNNYLLVMHAICVPFIMLHWVINDNTCVLSVIELEIRKKLKMPVDKKACFTCQLIDPIYDFKANNEDWSEYIYIFTTLLWLTSVYKLYSMYQRGEIVSMQDLLLKENTTSLFC